MTAKGEFYLFVHFQTLLLSTLVLSDGHPPKKELSSLLKHIISNTRKSERDSASNAIT